MPDCLFCKIIGKEIPSSIIYEDEKSLAFLDIRPVNPGHTLVVPKQHADNILACRAEDLHAVMDTVQKITPAILAAVSSPAMNLGVNTGSVAGQAVSHFHLHIMPRFEADGRDLWHGQEARPGALEDIAGKIRQSLEV